MFKEIGTYLVENTPWYVKWFLAVVIVPNLIFFAIIFVFWFMPWHSASIQSAITPLEEARNQQIKYIVEGQAIQNNMTNDSLRRIEQHQSVLLQEMLRRSASR